MGIKLFSLTDFSYTILMIFPGLILSRDGSAVRTTVYPFWVGLVATVPGNVGFLCTLTADFAVFVQTCVFFI